MVFYHDFKNTILCVIQNLKFKVQSLKFKIRSFEVSNYNFLKRLFSTSTSTSISNWLLSEAEMRFHLFFARAIEHATV